MRAEHGPIEIVRRSEWASRRGVAEGGVKRWLEGQPARAFLLRCRPSIPTPAPPLQRPSLCFADAFFNRLAASQPTASDPVLVAVYLPRPTPTGARPRHAGRMPNLKHNRQFLRGSALHQRACCRGASAILQAIPAPHRHCRRGSTACALPLQPGRLCPLWNNATMAEGDPIFLPPVYGADAYSEATEV